MTNDLIKAFVAALDPADLEYVVGLAQKRLYDEAVLIQDKNKPSKKALENERQNNHTS